MYHYIKEKEFWLPIVASLSSGFWLLHSLSLRPASEETVAGVFFILAALACIVLSVALVFIRAAAGEARLSRQVFFLTVLLFVYLSVCIASVGESVTPSVSAKRIMLTHVPVLVCFISIAISREYAVRQVFNKFLMFLVWVTAFLVLVALLIYFFGVYFYDVGVGPVQHVQLGPFILGQRAMGYPPLFRVSSFTGNPNQLGLLASISIIAILYFKRLGYLASKPKFYLLLLMVLGLGLSQSRTAIMSSIICVLFFNFLVSGKKEQYAPLIILGFLFGVVAVVLLGAISGGEAIGQGNRLTFDLSGRDQIWGEILGAFVNRPLLGIGFGTSGDYLAFQGYDQVSVHNFYVQLLSEAGLLGLLSFFVFLAALLAFVCIRKKTAVDSASALFYAVILAILILVLANQMAESSLYRGVFLHFFFFFVLSCGVSRRDI